MPKERDQTRCSFMAAWPLVAVVADEPQQSAAKDAEDYLPVSYVKLYSLQSHSYTHSIAVPGEQQTGVFYCQCLTGCTSCKRAGACGIDIPV